VAVNHIHAERPCRIRTTVEQRPLPENIKPRLDLRNGHVGSSPDPALSDARQLQNTETRMRRSLGLQARMQSAVSQRSAERLSPDQRKRRFVQDGEVPVTVVPDRGRYGDASPRPMSVREPVNRVEAAQTALAAERADREQARRALHEALATIHDLRTKLGHAELALTEAREAAKAGMVAADRLSVARQQHQEQMRAATAVRQAAEAALEAERRVRKTAEQRLRETAGQYGPPPVKLPAKRGGDTKTPPRTRPAQASKQRATQPVKWWIKSGPGNV
jgi:hypothetical protein